MISMIQVGDKVAIGYDATTGERGFLTKILNGTGVASVKGTVVSHSTSVDDAFILQANEFDAVGVVAEAGVADGVECWIWKNGSICEVLLKDGESATRGYVAICADTDGRALNIAVPTSTPADPQHFKEIGHVCESKTSGTDVLVLVDIHFN